MKLYVIYTLTCPISMNVRYVGCTGDVKSRLYNHSLGRDYVNSDKVKWLISLKRNGLAPILEEIEIVNESSKNELEKYWIRQFNEWGFNLLNKSHLPTKTKYKPRKQNNS